MIDRKIFGKSDPWTVIDLALLVGCQEGNPTCKNLLHFLVDQLQPVATAAKTAG